jgi:outer membrane lipoprotein-sorting protein
MAGFDDDPKSEQDLDLAMAGLYGVTSTTSGTVPGYLLGQKVYLFRLLDLSLLNEADAEDGTRCIRLHGTDFGGGTSTIWIGAGDNLIRRVETVGAEGEEMTVKYSPQPNAKVSAAELAFRRPSGGELTVDVLELFFGPLLRGGLVSAARPGENVG